MCRKRKVNKPTASKKEIGQRGEELAADFLLKKGLFIISRNIKTPLGEIDLLAKDGSTLVVVEVKAQKSRLLNSPLEEITSKKLEKLSKLAQYISRSTRHQNVRVDIVGINFNLTPAKVEHLANVTI